MRQPRRRRSDAQSDALADGNPGMDEIGERVSWESESVCVRDIPVGADKSRG